MYFVLQPTQLVIPTTKKGSQLMQQSNPQPSMPQEKLILFLFLLAAAFTLAIYLYANGVFNDEKIGYPLVGVMTTLFIVSGVELLPEAVRWLRRFSKRARFCEFFGEAVLKEDIRLVFPHRTLSVKQKTNPFVTRQESGTDAIPEGVNGWLAFQDVRAAVYVSNMISEMTNMQIIAVQDKDVETDTKNYCIVSFGLGFTGFTHFVSRYLQPQLFKITWGPSAKDKGIQTDAFTIADKEPNIPDGFDVAIVARIVPRLELGHPRRVWFVCAGRSAAGTAAAGYYLANHWEEIHELYSKERKNPNKDSVVLVIKHNENTGIGAKAREYPLDNTAQLLINDDGKKFINWGRAAGII